MHIRRLNLKACYFDQIKAGTKTEEYRLCSKYWTKRLDGRTFDRIVLMRGYPGAGDPDRRLERPWRGCEVRTIEHVHFGDSPAPVYAIRVN